MKRRKPIIAWAVVCRGGKRHNWTAGDKISARRTIKAYDKYCTCGPHKAVKLVEEKIAVAIRRGGEEGK